MTRLEVADTVETLNRWVAEHVVRVTTEAVRARGRCAIVLAGGSTPKGAYGVLADEPYRSSAPWAHIDVFWGDERHVPPDHPDSNYRMATETLLSKVPVPASRIHRIRAEDADPQQAAREYEAEIRTSFGQPSGPPRFDLILLGLGHDGHTASLFPGSPALEERRRLCVATRVERLNAERITLTLPVLNAARDVLFVVSGGEKADIVREVLDREVGPTPLPVQRVRVRHGDETWMLDQAAARYVRPFPG